MRSFITSLLLNIAIVGALVPLLTPELEKSCNRGQLRFVQTGKYIAAGNLNGPSDIVNGTFDDQVRLEFCTTKYDEIIVLYSPQLPSPHFQLNAVGWMYLTLHTNASYNNYQQAYAAGYAEGSVAVERTWQSLMNSGAVNATLPGPVMAWLDNNTAFMHTQILANPNVPYWHHLALLFIQTQGLADGYNDHAPPSQRLSDFTFLLMNVGGDLDDLMWLASDADIKTASKSLFGRVRR